MERFPQARRGLSPRLVLGIVAFSLTFYAALAFGIYEIVQWA